MDFKTNQFNPELSVTAEGVAKYETFKRRIDFNRALIEYMNPLRGQHFMNCSNMLTSIAQDLTFIPRIKSGWGPLEKEVKQTAQNIVSCYLAQVEAFTAAGFPRPREAALEELKLFNFTL